MLYLISVIIIFLISKRILPVCIGCLIFLIFAECFLICERNHFIASQNLGASVEKDENTVQPISENINIFNDMRNKERDHSRYSIAVESLKQALLDDIKNSKKKDPFRRQIR